MSARLVTTLVAAGVLLSVAACGDGGAGEWLASARAVHDSADRALAAGDLDAARRSLQGFATQPPPEGVGPEDARVVRQDVFYRLSRLALREGDAEAAKGWAERGLALGRRDDVFTANLLVARGQALEALGQGVEAAADYHDALRINERLLDALLDGDEP